MYRNFKYKNYFQRRKDDNNTNSTFNFKKFDLLKMPSYENRNFMYLSDLSIQYLKY